MNKPINIASVRENLEQRTVEGDKIPGGTEEQFYQPVCSQVRPHFKDRKWVYLGIEAQD